MRMYHTSCNLCGEDKTKIILKQSNYKYFPRSIVRCLNCGLVYVNPQFNATELRRLYQEDPPEGINDSSPSESPVESLLPQSVNVRIPLRLCLLKRLIKPGRLLDVGCSIGEFLYYAKSSGWQACGVDISSFAVQRASKITGLEIQEGTIADFSERKDTFDLITMWEVIEHLPHPSADIRRAYQLLKPNGLLGISTPNLNSLRHRAHKEKWRGFIEDETHLFFFQAKTLTQLLMKHGFKIKKVLSRKISPVLFRFLVYFGLGNELEVYAQKA